jgi:hypothetical protein
MLKKTLASALFLGALVPLSAFADKDSKVDSLVRFEGGIGSQPLRAGGTPNLVQGLNPGGAPWIIEHLSANVKVDGTISVSGKGLLLGGGNGIGGTGNQTVHARLYCGTVFSETTGVLLDPSGDFKINEALVPTPVAPCATPILLILNPGNAWFAAGIPKLKSNDD